MKSSDSEFIKDFFENCLAIDLGEGAKLRLKSLFNKLRKDNRVITIQDFGAGSKKLGNERKISTILKTSSSKGKYGKLLYQMVKHYQFKNCLEFGTSLGVGTNYLALGNSYANITTIEACESTRNIALENFASFNNVKSEHSTFDEFLSSRASASKSSARENDDAYDFVFIDGHHDGDALINYLEKLKPLTNANTIYVLDDIRWSDSMLKAWDKIVKSGEFEVIDLFRVGVVKMRD
ncbi:MAG TPA: hypothetical protein EYG86_01085 [Crocinitomicaceae bacterium]|nr:hypothetical protein [Crocinitomicaceae bacterium]